jgi:hypothetical protein
MDPKKPLDLTIFEFCQNLCVVLRIPPVQRGAVMQDASSTHLTQTGTNMRKRIVTATPTTAHAPEAWLDLEGVASVEVTSEDKDFPIESSLSMVPRQGWRAAQPGTQTVRLIFDKPQELKRISLVFEENEITRTQEFVLRASSNPGGPFREIVRQQWNFSAPTSTREIEQYAVELPSVALLELTVVPDISGGAARASLKSLRLS